MVTTCNKPKETSKNKEDEETKQTRPGRKPGAGGWQAWEDRAIAKQAHAARPWKAGKVDGGPVTAWEQVAAAVARANSAFNRSGPACQTRFRKLLDIHKACETRDKQATGETAEIDEHVEIMTDLYNIIRDDLDKKKTLTNNAKSKINLERKAGTELRDAATTGIVPRDTLCDITELEGSTSREKGGQRKEKKRTRSSSPSNTNSDNESDVKQEDGPLPKKRKSTQQQLIEKLAESRSQASKKFEAASQRDEERHDELRDALQGMSTAVTTLAATISADSEARNKQHSDLVGVITKLVSK